MSFEWWCASILKKNNFKKQYEDTFLFSCNLVAG